jgi:anti-anti-sigma regulatory factor
MCSLAWPWYAPRVDKHMLKITKQTESTKLVRVKLHGSFTGEYVSELEKALLENGCKRGKVALDLMNVTFVDREAMEFLRRAISRKKIAIENIPSYVTRWIEQEVS